jgi:hypothetical protein
MNTTFRETPTLLGRSEIADICHSPHRLILGLSKGPNSVGAPSLSPEDGKNSISEMLCSGRVPEDGQNPNWVISRDIHHRENSPNWIISRDIHHRLNPIELTSKLWFVYWPSVKRRDSSVGNSKGLGARRLGFDSDRGKVFLFSTTSRSASWPTQPPIQWAPLALSPEVNRRGREADHLSTSSAEEWRYISTPSHVFMARCLIN